MLKQRESFNVEFGEAAALPDDGDVRLVLVEYCFEHLLVYAFLERYGVGRRPDSLGLEHLVFVVLEVICLLFLEEVPALRVVHVEHRVLDHGRDDVHYLVARRDLLGDVAFVLLAGDKAAF